MGRTNKARKSVSKRIADISAYVEEEWLDSLTAKQRRRAVVLLNYLDRAERIAAEIEQGALL